jgi:predicted peptidase
MHRILFSFLAFLLFPAMVNAQTPDLFDKLIFNVGKDSLPYRLLKPVNPDALERFPLIIFLHGAGERGNDNEAQIKHISDLVLDPKYRGKYPCYVLAPQCPKGEWWAAQEKDGTMKKNPTKPTEKLIQLIEQILKQYPIDERRIYITGVSMGGYGTWELMARLPDKFAAAVPICGGGDEKSAEKIKHIPTWAFHGAKDNVVSPRQSRRMISALQKVGGTPGYTEYPDVEHNSWVQAYKEPHLLPWLFKQELNAQAAK